MKHVLNNIPIVLLLSLSVTACSSKNEIDVNIATNPYSPWGASIIYVQSVDNEVIVREVVINRGNCVTNYPVADHENKPIKRKALKYGETFSPTTLCKLHEIREVSVTTDKDTYTYTFE